MNGDLMPTQAHRSNDLWAANGKTRCPPDDVSRHGRACEAPKPLLEFAAAAVTNGLRKAACTHASGRGSPHAAAPPTWRAYARCADLDTATAACVHHTTDIADRVPSCQKHNHLSGAWGKFGMSDGSPVVPGASADLGSNTDTDIADSRERVVLSQPRNLPLLQMSVENRIELKRVGRLDDAACNQGV